MKQLWHGGTIYTMEEEHHTVEAVLTDNGKIIATGTLSALEGREDKKINLNGSVMYPGFVDSHLHMLFLGMKLTMLDLTDVSSTDEMLELIKHAAESLPEDAWLMADGWDENKFPDRRIPTIEELDHLHKGPIHLTRVCHHVALNNSSALAFADIDSSTVTPAGGKIGKNEDGTPNGLLYDQAINLITDNLPKEGEAFINSLTDALDKAIDSLLTVGLTGGHTEDMHYFGSYTNPLTAFYETIGKKHHFRANLLRHHEVFAEMAAANLGFDEPFIEPGAMKIFIDGAFGGSTAALNEPYADDPDNDGLLLHTDQELEDLVQLARKHREAVAIHMIGDRAAAQALDAIEKYPVPEGKKDRFIHCSVLDNNLIERIAKLPIVVDAQPMFVPSDFPWLNARLGTRRAKLAYPWRSLLDKGAVCAAGTDAPIEPIDPLNTIYAAIERKSPGASESNYPEQKISRFEAIQMYTVGSAHAINKEHVRGLIKEGYDADFTVFDRDLFAGTPDDLLAAKAVKTVVAGKTVFEA